VIANEDDNRYDVKLVVEIVLPNEIPGEQYEYFTTLERPID
jgi:hypothetical protein